MRSITVSTAEGGRVLLLEDVIVAPRASRRRTGEETGRIRAGLGARTGYDPCHPAGDRDNQPALDFYRQARLENSKHDGVAQDAVAQHCLSQSLQNRRILRQSRTHPAPLQALQPHHLIGTVVAHLHPKFIAESPLKVLNMSERHPSASPLAEIVPADCSVCPHRALLADARCMPGDICVTAQSDARSTVFCGAIRSSPRTI